jgi:hypothetical protein
VQVFDRKGFKLLAGFWLSRKVKSRNSVATLTPVSSDSFVPRPARRKN